MLEKRASASSADSSLPQKAELERLYRENVAYTWSVFQRFGAQPSDIPDLCHDVFMVLFRRLDDFDRDRPVRPWICGIAFRILSAHRRKAFRHRESADDDLDSYASDERGPESEFEGLESKELVQRALQKLPLPQRAVFVMHELQELSAPEIAIELDIPLNTAYSRLRLARAAFSKAIRSLASGAPR